MANEILRLARQQYRDSGVHNRLQEWAKKKHGKVSEKKDVGPGQYGETLEWETNWRIRKSLFKKKYITIRHKKHTVSITADGHDASERLTVEGKQKVRVGGYSAGYEEGRKQLTMAVKEALRSPETKTARSKNEQIEFHNKIINVTQLAEYLLIGVGAFSALAGAWSEIRLNAGGQPWLAPHSPRTDLFGTIPFHYISNITHLPAVSRFSHWSLLPIDRISPQDVYVNGWLNAESGADAAVSLLSYAGIRKGEKVIRREKRKIEKLSVAF